MCIYNKLFEQNIPVSDEKHKKLRALYASY